MPARSAFRWIIALVVLSSGRAALATPEFVEHVPQTQVFGEAGGVTMREADTPRTGNAVDIWVRIGYSFYYTDLAIYYTTDGSDPTGSKGVASGSTNVLHNPGGIDFIRNESSGGGTIDWWKGTLPAQSLNVTVKYKIGAWHNSGGPEVFSNNYNCSDGTCDEPGGRAAIQAYRVRDSGDPGAMSWPGGGHGSGHVTTGFPNIHHWKEEAVAGNNYMNVQIDQNSTIYDLYFPGAGCVQGVATKNEGYVDGADTFPGGLPLGFRGQMHVNQAQAGLRIDGITYWLSNEAGAYDSHTQAYVTDTNVISSSSRLAINSYNITVQQYDFCPKGITYPTDGGGQPSRHLFIKRYLLTNNGGSARNIDFYYDADFALNGGDNYDFMFADIPRGALVAYDNIQRTVNGTGNGTGWGPNEEYNPASFANYTKSASVYLGAAVKVCNSVGSSSGTPASDSWRNSSTDSTAGWVGARLTLNPGETKEVDVAIAGGFDNFANGAGTYNYFIAPAFDWFQSNSMATMQTTTENYWTTWLANGTTIDTPNDTYDALFKRSLLATALHLDAKGGGVVAGMHNGAYPFVWPRDALYAANTLDRTGHTFEAGEVYRFLKDVAFRDNDTWGKGFWYQKYTTDGYKIWTSPQVDETANVTWGGYYHFLTTGSLTFLQNNYVMFWEAAKAMSEDSTINGQLYFDDANNLMHGNNVWEDSFDDFVYSNAAVERGLRDMVKIAQVLDATSCGGGPGACGYDEDAALFTGRANQIHTGLNGRLDWDGENTDISQIGCAWPFETHTPTDARMVHLLDRMNGVANDRFGNNHPIVNFSGEFQDLVNRYHGDTYWNGGPWFLSTLWYGQYYAKRQDFSAGKADVDNFKSRIDKANTFLGPSGLAAEQIAPSSSLQYPGFKLQTAWPNAWESMSFYVDCLMLFLDHRPDAYNNKLYLAPKLPTGWVSMTFRNIKVGSARVDVTAAETLVGNGEIFKNLAGTPLTVDTWIRLPVDAVVTSVKKDGSPVAYTHDPVTDRVHVVTPISTGVDVVTTIDVSINDVLGDFNHDGHVDNTDFDIWKACATRDNIPQTSPECLDGNNLNVFSDFDGDTDVDLNDYARFQRCYTGPTQPDNPTCDD